MYFLIAMTGKLLVYLSLIAALLLVHVRTQATLIGYELGTLKQEELRLLEKRNRLQLELARLTDKQELIKAAHIINTNTDNNSKSKK